MNFIQLTSDGGHKFRVNLAHVVAYETACDGSTRVELANGSTVWCIDPPEFIDGYVNGMAAFSGHGQGKRDVGEAPAQDTRTQLLIEAMWLLYGSTIPGAKWLYDAIKREVGEAAIEQYEAGAPKREAA